MPVLPQLLGSAFNIWYNAKVIEPLLETEALRERFIHTVIAFNVAVYPLAVAAWTAWVLSLKPAIDAQEAGREVPAHLLLKARQRAVNLPWLGSILAAFCWLACIPVFLGADRKSVV